MYHLFDISDSKFKNLHIQCFSLLFNSQFEFVQ